MKNTTPQFINAPVIRAEAGLANALRTLLGIVLAWLMLGSWALASPAVTRPPVTGGVLRATLSNGLKVVIVPSHLAPVVTTVMNYHVGSDEAPPGFPGMAHAQEHMMFRGSPGLTAGQLSAIAAAMGGDFDADTQQAVTQYFFTVPARYLDMALHIESIRMRGVLDSESLWKEERGAIEQEVARDLSDPGYLAYKKILAQMFHGTAYAHDALGTRPSFDKTTGAMLHTFYRKWYAPNNATLVIAGDVDPKQTLDTVKRLLGPIAPKKLPDRPRVHLEPVRSTTIHMNTDRPYGLVLLAYRMPGYDDPDYAAAQVLAQVLSNQRSSLYSRLVPKGKALGTELDLNAMRPGSIGMAIAAFPKGEPPKPLLNEMRSILETVAVHGVPADLVEAAKRRVVTQAQAQQGSIPGLAMQWSQALVVERRQSPKDTVRAIEHVSVQDVDRVARQYFDTKHAIVAVLTPQGSGQPSRSQGFGGKESFAPSHVAHIELPAWAAKPLAAITAPSSRLHPTDTRLPNGLRLIIQPETVSGVVHVYGHIKSRPGLETPPGEEGVDRVLDRLLDYGTASMDRIAFQKALDDIGASASLGSDFSLQVLAAHFGRGMQLLADAERHPALPEKAFAVVRKEVAGSVAGEIASPDFKMHQALGRALYPAGDPTLRHPTPASVSALTLKAVRSYYDKTFRPDLCSIVIVGDVTPETAKEVVKQYFGDWKASGPKPATGLPAVPPNLPHTAVVPDHARVQDKVTLAETLGLTRSNPAYYALVLGNQVLSGGFYASRLYSALREKRGLVYTVASFVDAHKTRATFRVVYGAYPKNVQKARALVNRALEAMQTKPVSKVELHRAQAGLVRRMPLREASESAIARGLLERASEDLPLDEPMRAARHYLRLNAQDVQNAYKAWIRPKDFVQVSQGPSPQTP